MYRSTLHSYIPFPQISHINETHPITEIRKQKQAPCNFLGLVLKLPVHQSQQIFLRQIPLTGLFFQCGNTKTTFTERIRSRRTFLSNRTFPSYPYIGKHPRIDSASNQSYQTQNGARLLERVPAVELFAH